MALKNEYAKTQGERPKGCCWILKSINHKTKTYTWYRLVSY